MIKLEITERELDCLIWSIEVDEEILNEIIEYENITDDNSYCKVLLTLLEKLKKIREEVNYD